MELQVPSLSGDSMKYSAPVVRDRVLTAKVPWRLSLPAFEGTLKGFAAGEAQLPGDFRNRELRITKIADSQSVASFLYQLAETAAILFQAALQGPGR